MHNSKFILLLCYSVLAFSFIHTEALDQGAISQRNELKDALRWDELKNTDSDTVNTVTQKCEEILLATRTQYQGIIQHLQQLLPQIMTSSTLKSHVEDAIEEISKVMRASSTGIDKQLEDLGEIFLKRLNTVINAAQSVSSSVTADLEQIYRTEIDETDKLAIAIRSFVAEDYNPLNKILPTMHKSLNYHADYLEEFRKIVRNDLELLLTRLDQELDQLESVVIGVLNRISQSMTVMKVVYASIKKTGHMPREWPHEYIMEILRKGTLMSKTASVDDNNFQIKTQEEPSQPTIEQPVDTEISTFKLDEERSSEQDDQDEREEDDLGCVLIFSRTKRRMLKELIVTVTKIKSLNSIKEIDHQSLKILDDYRLAFHELHLQLVSKIVDYTHNFVKLYIMHIEIMDLVNPGLKLKMQTIFDDTSVDQNSPVYGEIQRFLNSNFLTSANIEDLRQQIEGSIRGAKTLKEIQKKVSKELVTITTTLGKDMEEMKMVIVYILEQMREGVLSLKHIKENANMTGYRRFINFYDAKEDLKQLKKLIMILNMLDVNVMFDRELTEIVSSNQIKVSRGITNLLLEEINTDSTKFNAEVDKSANITDVKKTVTKYVIDLNKMVHNFTYKLRKSVKRMVTMFITIHEEFIILVNRRQIQIVELENIPESADLETEIGLIINYLAENALIDVVKQYGGRFNIDSSNIDKSKAVVKQQMHTLIQTMSTELSQLDLQVENVIDKIIQEARNIELIKRELATNENLTIQAEQFPNLGLILYLSDFLQVLAAQNNVKKSHNQEVNKTFNSAKEQIQTAKVNAERAIQESTDMSQLKVHVAETTISIRSVLLDVGSDLKENLTEMSSNFENMFETFTSTNSELKDQILNAKVEMETVSEQLQDYLTNRYANHALSSFNQILLHTPHSLNMAQTKQATLTSLNETMDKIEQDMDLVKKETIINVVEKLSQGIELMEHLQNKGKLVITEEETSLLAMGNNVVSILQNFFSTDSTYNADEMQNAINTARETVTKEFSRAITSIQTLANEADIQTELNTSTQSIADTYTSLTTNIQSQLQSFATTFTESYEAAMSNVLGKNDQLELKMQDIMNRQIASKQSIQLENAIAFINSDAFLAASEWLSSSFKSIMQDTLTHSNSIKEAATHQLDSLHGYIDNAIGNMHEAVVSLVEDFKQSSTIIQTIKSDQKVDLNDDQINSLSNSFKLIQMLTRESATIASNSDFNSAKQQIVEEYQNTVKAIEGLSDNAMIHDITVKAVDSYTNIYENLRSATVELFSEKTSEFSASYNSVKEMAEYTGNVDLKNMLTEITQNKETLQPSPQLQQVEAFVKSEQFTSSTVVQEVFENQPQVPDIQKLNTVTTEVESYIGVMEQVSSFVQTEFAAATEFLTSIENSNIIQWSQEQITIITETITITEIISIEDKSEASSSSKSSESNSAAESDLEEQSTADVRSLDQTTQEMATIISSNFSEARNKILAEFDSAQNLIEAATDEISIQQTMTVSIERISTIFEDVQNKFKDEINNDWENYKNSIQETINKVTENVQLQTILQEVLENKEYSANLDADFSKLSTTITGDIYQSANLVNTMYENIHSNMQSNIGLNEKSLEELRLITTNISQDIVEMEFSETYIQQKLEQGSVILKEIASGAVQQLSEEQINILSTNTQIGELLQMKVSEIATPSLTPAEISVTPVEIPYISETRGLINNELQTAINTIQTMEIEESIVEATTVTVQKTETMFNELKSNFQGQVAEKLTEFKEEYMSVIEITEIQGNEQLEGILQNTVNSENTGTNAFFGEVQSFMESTVFTSTTVITDMFEAFKTEESPMENTKDWNLNALQTISSNINEHITQIENIATTVQGTLQQGITILETIKSEQIVELTEEQISVISSSMQLEQILPLQTPAAVHITEKEFTETEVAIKQEFERTVAALELLNDEGAINDVVATTIVNADSVYTVLKEKVQVEITTIVTVFEEVVTTFEAASHGHDNTVLEQVDEIFHGETIVAQKEETLVQIENFLTSDVYNSPATVQTLFDNIQQNQELNIVERSIQSIRELDIQVTDNIETMHGVSQNIFQTFEQGTEIMKIIQNDNKAEFTDEQVQVLSVCHELSKLISPTAENSVTNDVPMEAISEEFIKAKVEINEVCETSITKIQSLVDETAIEQVALESVHSSETIYNDLKRAAQDQTAVTVSTFQQTIETTLVTVQENGNEELINTLQNLPKYQNSADEAFNKFESFKNSNSYTSDHFVENLYQDMQNKISQSMDSVQHKQVEQLRVINTTLNEEIENLQGMSTYTTENISKGLEILETIQNDSSVTLTQEQIQTLALSNTIAAIPSVPPAIIEEKETPLVPPVTEDNNGWNMFGLLPNGQPDINLIETKETIHQEYSKTVEILQTLTTEEEIQPVVSGFVDNSNSVYNTARENIHNKMAENAQSMLQHYDSTMNVDYEGNENLQNVVRDLNTEAYEVKDDAEYVEFETFVTSSYFTSVETIKETFVTIQENTPAIVNDSIAERNIQQLGILNQRTDEYIDEIQKMETYVDNNFQQVSEILTQIEKKEIVQLTTEQIQTLTTGQEIIQNLIPREEAMEIPPENQIVTESVTQTVTEIDITTTIVTLTEELNTSVQAIESAPDENTVQQIVTNSVEKYEEVFSTVRTEMQTKMVETVSTYESDYTDTLNTVLESGNNNAAHILQNIDTIQVEQSETLMQFESFIGSETYKSPSPVVDTYNALRQEDAISSLTSFNEKGVQELNLLNQQVIDNINKMQTTTTYAEENLQSGLDILHSIQADAAADLTDNQIQELVVCQKVVEVVKTTIVETEIINTTDVETINLDNRAVQEAGIDTATALNTVQEDYEKAINVIRSATEAETVQTVVTDNIQNMDSVYSKAQLTVKHEMEVNVTQFSEVRDSIIGNEAEIDNGVRNILQNIPEQRVNFETDENFKQFENFVNSNQFQSSTLANDMYQQIQQNENQYSTNINERAEEELTQVNTQVQESITMLEQTKQYVDYHVGQGTQVLQSAQQNPAYHPTEQELVELSLSQTIITTLLSVTVVEIETQTDLVEEITPPGPEITAEVPVAVETIQNEKEEAVNRIREMTDEESIKQVVTETVHHFDAKLSEVQQSTDQKLNECTRQFEDNYQSAIQLIETGDSEQYKRILEGELTFTADDQFEAFEKYMKNGGAKLPTADTILRDVEENGELITHDTNEKYTVELDIVSTQVSQNIVELTEMTSYATTHLEKGSAVLDSIVADQNTELKEQQIQEVILSQRIMQVITTAVTEEHVEILTTPKEQIHIAQPIPEVDFVNAELQIDRKVDESLQKINALTSEEEIVQVVEENVHESSTMYCEIEQNVRKKIDISSTSFMETFQTAVNNTPDDSPLKAILGEILNHKTPFPSDLNAEFEQVQSEINDQNIMSSSAVDKIFSNIRESETLPADIKERSIMEVKTLNEEVKKNIDTMKHIDEFVCTNLQDGLTVLQDIEGQQVQELTEQQIRSLSISTTISETVTTAVEESTSWGTFLSYGTVVVPSSGEAEQTTIQSSTTEVENHSTVVEVGDDTVQVTKSITSTTEIQEVITTTVYEEEASQCMTMNNVTSVKGKIKNTGTISVNNLVVTVNANSLSACQHLKWNLDRFSPEDKQIIEEIRGYLLAAQNIFTSSVPFQQNRLNLYENMNDILVIFVNTTELMDEVLQQLSYVIMEKIVLLITPILKQIENSDIQRDLENISSNLDAEFIDSIELFCSLMLYEKTDILTLVDEQFANAQCTSISISREIIQRKFSLLNEIIEKILSRILCIILLIIDLIINSKISLQTNVQHLELIKNIQLLYDIISQINT